MAIPVIYANSIGGWMYACTALCVRVCDVGTYNIHLPADWGIKWGKGVFI